ncbi:hypothetical protein ACFLSW_03140 [Candidatus Bipolaricaulota bacterium]
MKRAMIAWLALFGLLCVSVWVGAQTAELTMWTFPEPDRLPSDLAISSDGEIYMAFYLGVSIGRLDPEANTLVEWALEDSPSHLAITSDGIFYTQPNSSALGFLDPDLTYTLVWPVPAGGSYPNYLLPTDQGSGYVNIYISERRSGKIALFEPETIEFRSFAGVPRVPVPLIPLSTNLTPAVETVVPLVVEAADPFAPPFEQATPVETAPFREWTPTFQGEIGYIDGLALGGDGGIWFSQGLEPYVSVLIPWDDLIARYALPEGTSPGPLAAAPDESIWLADISRPSRIGRLQMETGDVELWEVPDGLQPYAFAFDEAEDVWFSDREMDAIYRFDPDSNTFTWWVLPLGTHPLTIAESEPGTFWFVSEGLNAVGRLVISELD